MASSLESMDLKKFNDIIKVWLEQFNNVSLSGVARVTDGSKVYWSASIGVTGKGDFPEIKIENIKELWKIVERKPIKDFVLEKLFELSFITILNQSEKRWQVQWLFLKL